MSWFLFGYSSQSFCDRIVGNRWNPPTAKLIAVLQNWQTRIEWVTFQGLVFLSQKFCGILICSSNCYWHYQPFSVLKHEGLTTNRTFHITKSKMIHWWFATENNCYLLTVPRHCWLGSRKGIWPLKNWVMGCWRGYPSGARCRLAYGPADATATHCLMLQ